jgi:subtilisin family serine protease
MWKIMLALSLLAAAPASAQLPRLPGLGGIGGGVTGLPGVLPQGLPSLQTLDQPLTAAANQAQALLQARTGRIDGLLRAHPAELDRDGQGFPVVRGEVLAIDPQPEALATAAKLGFQVTGHAPSDLGFDIVTLSPPARLTPDQALRQLRRADKQGRYDLNHIYLDAGQASAPQGASLGPKTAPDGPTVRIGFIDTGVNAAHPVFSQSQLHQQGFTSGGVQPADHGTATAGLAVAGRPGTQAWVADVYGGQARGGAADAVARALGWMAQQGAPVVNISLVGPPNLVLQAAVQALTRRGVIIVAAVGNDGPAAPPAYPASFPEVIAVTGVDRDGRVMLEAGAASHVDFAALGVDVAGAQAGGGYGRMRGTSFAAPVVAAALARLHQTPGAADAQAAVQQLARQAKDLGPRGRDKTFGYGLISP